MTKNTDTRYTERVLDKYDGVITAEDVKKDSDLRKYIQSKIQNEYTEGELYMKPKLKAFEEWYKKYTNPWVYKTNYIKSHVLHQHLKMFIATFFESEMSVEFLGRNIGDEDRAYKISKLAEFQADIMNKDFKDRDMLWNVGFYWANIELKNWHDWLNTCVDYVNVSPLYWKPDPKGNVFDDNFQYHYFDLVWSLPELDEKNSKFWDVYFNLDRITSDYDDRDGEWSKKAIRLLWDSDYYSSKFKITLGFTIIKGIKYRIETTQDRWNIIRFEAVEAVTEKQKKNRELVRFPLNVTNVFPLRDDPCGLWYAELVLEYQNAKNRLLNMAIIKEQENAGFQQVLVDVNKISNLNLLKEKSDKGRTYIPADWDWQPLANAIAPIQSDRVDGNTLNIADKIDFEAQMETGMTSQQRWVTSPWEKTLWQLEIEQINSNVAFGLDSKMLWMCQARFWKNIWYADLLLHLSEYNKVLFSIGSELDNTKIEIEKRELIWLEDVTVKIVNKKLQKGKDKQQLAFMQANLPLIMQDPNIPDVSKLIYKRALTKKAWFSKEYAENIYKLTPDEVRAKRYVDMINNDIEPKAFFKPWMDYYTYYIYISWCKDNPLKEKIMSRLLMEMEKRDIKPQNVMPWMEWWPEDMTNLTNSMGSQMTSNLVQQNSSDRPSREDI